MEKKIYFNYEKLEVYQFSLQFIEWLNPLWRSIWKNRNIADQLERASCLDVIVIKKLLNNDEVLAGKKILSSIVKMLTILSQTAINQINEEESEYLAGINTKV